MGEQLVSVVSPTGGAVKSPSFTKIFWDCLPDYLAMGMTQEEYFHGDPQLAKAYRKAFKLKQDNKRNYDNWLAWLQGSYIYAAILCTAPRLNSLSPKQAENYIEKPYKFEDKKKKEKVVNPHKAILEAWAIRVNHGRDA